MKHHWSSIRCFDGLYNGQMTCCLLEECRCGKQRRVPENVVISDNEECDAKFVSVKAPGHPLDCQHKDSREVLTLDEHRHLARKQRRMP